jgi:type II secretory ATPase GspE/PulE/Tfp pilus assembly ATPase PilB-like protein
MIMSETIRRMVLTGASTDDIRAQATQEGTTSLWHDGMLKVKQGVTTPYEVIRNVFSIG